MPNFAYPTTPRLLTSSLVAVGCFTALCFVVGALLSHGLFRWETGWYYHAAEWGIATLLMLLLSYWLAADRR